MRCYQLPMSNEVINANLSSVHKKNYSKGDFDKHKDKVHTTTSTLGEDAKIFMNNMSIVCIVQYFRDMYL